MTSHSVRFAGKTHQGLVRERNEDAYALDASDGEWPLIFVVADGLGGHKNGELASHTAVEFIVAYLREHLPDTNDPEHIKAVLEEALQKTNVKVYLTSLEDDANTGMGTTLTLVVLFEHSCYIAHVGDSRCYMLRDHVLERLTSDDTYVSRMVEMGTLSEEESIHHPSRHILTQALGYPEYIDPDIIHVDLLEKDRFLLSSDGLHGILAADAIREALDQCETPDDVAASLIEQTLEAGAPDNVTVVVIFA
ncbi:MAG: Stp1/IreP family PP2C-type Ser/Thr phosphatase [Saccharofermentanales bacterium]|jgi:serine/threonine protein phosphatase PrpC